MALAETAKLVASLELKDHFTPSANKAMASLGKLEGRAFRVGQNIGKGFKNAATNIRNMGIVAAAGIAVAVKGGISSLADLEDATTSVDGAIKQMGQSGKITSQQIATWANEIESNVQAAFDDKEIVAATSTLIRFGKVAPANIRPAMQIITDLATKTGSVDSAASLLAKALADPTKAAGKLARSGVILTKGQQKQIDAFVKAGKVGKAQKVILDSLSKSTKGAAAASAGPYRDALNILADVTEDAQRALGIGFLPVISKVSKLLSSELAKPATIQAIKDFGTGLASGLDSLISIAQKLPWGTIGDSLKLAGAGAKAVLDAFVALPSWVQTAVLTGWGLNKLTGGALGGIGKELLGGLVSMFKGTVGITAGVVNVNGPVVGGGLPGGGGVNPIAAGAGLTGAAALGIGGGALLLGLVGAVNSPLWVKNTTLSTKLEEQGLTQAERAAQIYYTASAADQAQMQKHLSFLPTRADFEAGLAKLGKVIVPNSSGSPDDRDKTSAITKANDKTTTAVETMKGKMADDLANNKSAIDAAAQSTASATTTSGYGVGQKVAAGASMVASAVRTSRPIVTTDVRVYVTAAGVTKSVTQQSRYGPPGGSATGHAPGHGPLE